MKSCVRNLLAVAALTYGVQGCAADNQEPQEDLQAEQVAESQQTLAETTVGASTVSFVEAEPGTIVILARSQGSLVLNNPALVGKTAVEKYEILTGKPAPLALRKAHARSLALAEAAGEESTELDDYEPLEVEEDGPADKISGAQFTELFCKWDGPKKCFPDQTTDVEHEVRDWGVHGHVNAVSGDVRLQVRQYKTIGGWRTVLNAAVFSGQLVEYSVDNAGIRRPLKVKVYEAASPDIFHASMLWG